jgi:hypothetical protein
VNQFDDRRSLGCRFLDVYPTLTLNTSIDNWKKIEGVIVYEERRVPTVPVRQDPIVQRVGDLPKVGIKI